jgi:diacylglycerol O-acyltransferase
VSEKRESMSSVDVAWLRMDRPSNLMVICGVLVLDERVPIARLRSTVARRFLRFARFRQRPVASAGGYQWRPDERITSSASSWRAARATSSSRRW